MECQCPGCSCPAEPGGMLCQPCRDGIDYGRGRIEHPHDQPTEAEIQAALDFGRTAYQHLRG